MAKIYPVKIKGFGNQDIAIRPSGFFTGPQLLVNGRPAPRGARFGEMLLRRSDGREITARWKPQLLGLDTPALEVDGQLIYVGNPLRWYDVLWSALPILLVFVGGMVGVVVGMVAFTINRTILRSQVSPVSRYALTALVSVLAVVFCMLAVTLLYRVTG
ncbi:MAG TPA: hypothetical protein GX702_07320 [Chloroflexi bacterium]|jgi:hypothetical protein|nr:hypothetical protein [Chloroflexota bacterium]